MSRTIGVVDVGSNTVRLAVYAVEGGGACRLLAARREALRLAREGSHLDEAALRRTAAVLGRFRRVCRDYGAREILAVATAAVRQADNGPAFVAALRERTGIDCRILDGQTEAAMGFRAGLANLSLQDGVMVDVGGASTEVTVFRGRRMGAQESIPVGAVNATARWLPGDPPAKGAVRALQAELAAIWSTRPWLEEARGLPLAGIGGTFRALAKASQRRLGLRRPLHGTEVDAGLPAALVAELAALPSTHRASVPGIPAHRADIIVAGLAIVAELVAATGAPRIVVSGQGLREGLLLQALDPDGKGAVPDPFAQSLRACAGLFRVSPKRASRVAALALQLFDGLAPLHRYGPAERRALEVAAVLRDAGTAIDYYAREQHTLYLIRHAPLHGLSERERDLAAAAGAYEKLAGHRERWAGVGGSPADEAVAARLGLLVALADALADDLPRGEVGVSAAPSLVRVSMPVDRCGAAPVGDLGEDFRRLFGRPLAIGPATPPDGSASPPARRPRS